MGVEISYNPLLLSKPSTNNVVSLLPTPSCNLIERSLNSRDEKQIQQREDVFANPAMGDQRGFTNEVLR